MRYTLRPLLLKTDFESEKVQDVKKIEFQWGDTATEAFRFRKLSDFTSFLDEAGTLEIEFSQFSQQIEKSIFIGMAINPDGHWVLDGFHQSVLWSCYEICCENFTPIDIKLSGCWRDNCISSYKCLSNIKKSISGFEEGWKHRKTGRNTVSPIFQPSHLPTFHPNCECKTWTLILKVAWKED